MIHDLGNLKKVNVEFERICFFLNIKKLKFIYI